MRTTKEDVEALDRLIKAIPLSSGFWRDAHELLTQIHDDLEGFLRIEKAAEELLAAKDAINDSETLYKTPYAPMHRRLNEAWTALRIAVEGKE